MVWSFESSSINTASVIFLLVASPKHLSRILMDTGKVFPPWNNSECRCRGLLVSPLFQSSKCSFVLSPMLLPVCPRYFRLHSSHRNSYTQPLVLQSTRISLSHMMQDSLPQVVFLKGLLRWSSRLMLLSTFSLTLMLILIISRPFLRNKLITNCSLDLHSWSEAVFTTS